jgi:hypothetical protein
MSNLGIGGEHFEPATGRLMDHAEIFSFSFFFFFFLFLFLWELQLIVVVHGVSVLRKGHFAK